MHRDIYIPHPLYVYREVVSFPFNHRFHRVRLLQLAEAAMAISVNSPQVVLGTEGDLSDH